MTMKQIEVSWDTEKDKANQKKHGVSFQEAQTVFHDENARLIGSHHLEALYEE